MKKVIVFLLISLMTIGIAFADRERAITAQELPVKAQEFIKKYFPEAEISLIKKEVEYITRTTYKVVLVNGDKIEFNGSGEWREMEFRHTDVPMTLIPAPIRTTLTQKYPQQAVRQIEKLRRGRYEIKLSNGIELTLNKEGRILDLDID